MRFEWSETKRLATVKERGLDFDIADMFFDGRAAVHQASPRNGEMRWKTTALIEGKMVTVVWMWRDDVIRIISMRRSHAKEERRYRNIYDN